MSEVRIEGSLIVPHFEDDGPVGRGDVDGPVIDLGARFLARILDGIENLRLDAVEPAGHELENDGDNQHVAFPLIPLPALTYSVA